MNLQVPPFSPALKFVLLATAMVACGGAVAQDAKPLRKAAAEQPAYRIEGRQRVLALSTFDAEVARLKREDETRDFQPGAPLRYGVVRKFDGLSIHGDRAPGQWRQLADGSWRWRLEVSAPDARSLEFGFSDFRLPYGATLTISSVDGKHILPVLSDSDNPLGQRLHTPMLASSRAVLELALPAGARERTSLVLDSVTYGYRSPFEVVRAKSGSCNIDSICPEGDAWRKQIASVAMYTVNGFACSGSLVATGDREADLAQPRFATAYHCLSTQAEADTVVLYWGYESAACRTPGGTASGTPLPLEGNVLAVQTGGSTLVAANRATDFVALQLNSPVPEQAQPYYSGWDRSGVPPQATITVHHPQGDEKRISFNLDPVTTQANCIWSGSGPESHWRIGQYELGTTEQGSSGSGLWDQNTGLLVGVLSGGTASCSAPEGYDCYGRLSSAWGAQSTTGASFQSAFDRSGTNPQTQPGISTCNAPEVTLASNAFVQGATAGSPVTFSASASGGSGDITFAWDLDGDGHIDRHGGDQIVATYPSAQQVQVRVFATDAEGCRGLASHALDVLGPRIEAAIAGTPTQVCGNGNASMEPGERWSLPVRLTNTGAAAPAGAFALFAPSKASLPLGPNTFGYVGTSSASGGCDYDFIDLESGPYQVAALPTHVANGNEYGPKDDARSSEIALGGAGFPLYGQAVTAAVMSTNGYVSFDPNETGGDWAPACDADFGQGAVGPQLRPYHDDLLVGTRAGAGLRYRYFANCPRPAESGSTAQGCHVFQWSGMGYYGQDEDFGFQAIAYEQSGQVTYQYRSAASDTGELAVVGLIDGRGEDPFNFSCMTAHSTPALSAYCAFAPDGLPRSESLRVERPTLELPALATGESTVVQVPLAYDRALSCDAAPALDYVATAGVQFASAIGAKLFPGALAGGNCTAVADCPAQTPSIASRTGYFHDPARRGNGFANYSYGGLWFTAEPDRNTVWYEIAGQYQDNLLRTSIGSVVNQTPGDDEVTPQHASVGNVVIGRIDQNRQVFAWRFNDARQGAELQQALFAGLPHPSPNRTELWFNPDESGWGLAVEHAIVDGAPYLGASAYLFDAQGKARWLLVRGIAKSTASTLYSYQPHCPGCAWIDGWDESEQDAGVLQLEFTSRSSGMLDIDVNLPPPLQGAWQRTALPLSPIKEPAQ